MNDAEYRALVEQAHELNELAKHPGWETLVGVLNAHMLADKQRVLNGRLATHEEYKFTTGALSGIHYALDTPQRITDLAGAERERRQETG